MKPGEARKLSDEEVIIEVKRLKNTLFELRCQEVTEKIQDTSQVGKARRDIARMLTAQRERQLAAAAEQDKGN